MTKTEKLQYLAIVKNHYGLKTYKALAQQLKIPYVDKEQLFDLILQLSSDCNYRKFPWKLVLSNDRKTLKTYLNLMGDKILFETTEGVHMVIAYVLNELVDTEKLVYYDENFEALDKNVKLIADGKNACNLAITYLQQDIADLIGFTTNDCTTFRVNTGLCIRLKKSTKCYRMEAIDNVPSSDFGLVANNHYLLDVLGYKDEPNKFKYKDYEFIVENASAVYKVLHNYNTLIPTNCKWIEFCGLVCLGFKCALYDNNFKVYTIKKKVLMKFKLANAEPVVNDSIEKVNLRVNGTDFTWHVNKYVPCICEPDATIYEGIINTNGEGFPSTIFSVIDDPGKFVKVGKKLSTKTEVYAFVRANNCSPGAYLEGEQIGDLEQWQAIAQKASRIGKASVTAHDRKEGFKERAILFARITNEKSIISSVNNYARDYDGEKTTFDKMGDAVYYAIKVLLPSLQTAGVQIAAVDAPRLGAFKALRHASNEENLDGVELHEQWVASHRLVSSSTILKYLYKHKHEVGIQLLYETLAITYVGDGQVLRTKA